MLGMGDPSAAEEARQRVDGVVPLVVAAVAAGVEDGRLRAEHLPQPGELARGDDDVVAGGDQADLGARPQVALERQEPAIATLVPLASAGVGDALADDGPSAASGSIAYGLGFAPVPLNLKIRDGDAGPPAR